MRWKQILKPDASASEINMAGELGIAHFTEMVPKDRSTMRIESIAPSKNGSHMAKKWNSARRLTTAAMVVVFIMQALAPGLNVVHAAPALPLVVISEPQVNGGKMPANFMKACERSGYVLGQSLFWTCPGTFATLTDGATRITEFVRSCAAESSGGKVNVVACGVSGLVARLAIDAGMIPDGTVADLVMVASPNRGSFAACVLKSIVDVAQHEALFEKENRGWHLLPSGQDLLSLFGPKESGVSDYTRLTYPKDAVFADETAWVAKRVSEVYEPLYAKYVAARYSAIPYIPVQSTKETFAGWIRRTLPGFWETAVEKGVVPPDGLPVYNSGIASVDQGAPASGRDLSAGYYEILAMEVAKNQYVMRTASNGTVVESLIKAPYLPSGWKDALLHYGVEVLKFYAGKALFSVKAGLQKTLSNQLVKRTGFIEDSSSPLLRQLVKDNVVVNLGTSVSQRFIQIPANRYLDSLNSASLSESAYRSTRYISVAAKLASPWNLIWPQLGPNDFLLEVESTVSPQGPRDLRKTITGNFSPSGEGILDSKDFQTYLFAVFGEGQVEQTAVAKDGAGGDKSSITEDAYAQGDKPGADGLSVPEGASSEDKLPVAGTITTPVSGTGGMIPGSAISGTTTSGAPPDLSTSDLNPALSAYPLVRVVYRSKQTSHTEASETYHGYWLINYGDGTSERVDGNPTITFSHLYLSCGSYHVRAQSYDNKGNLLLERMWGVDVLEGDGPKEFLCRSIPRLHAEVQLTGPSMWVTGKPAVYTVELALDAVSDVALVSCKYDPGQTFCVLWERSGDFQVSCAVTARLQYFIEGQSISVENTYVREIDVEVLTTGVTR